jgi:signal transduction histidine kinase
VPKRTGLYTVLAVFAVAVVAAAGVWGIAESRRSAADEASRLFRVETDARARALESLLAGVRADLAFLAGSPPVVRLVSPGESAADADFRRQAAEAALLLFLRAHPEVTRLAVQGAQGESLLLTGRRGGVPVLWVSTQPTGQEGPALAPGRVRLATFVPSGSPPPGAPAETRAGIDAEIAPGLLLEREDAPLGGARHCEIFDSARTRLARAGAAPPEGARPLAAAASVSAEGWSMPAPWSLACVQPVDAAVALVAPVADRYRTSLILNLVVMALTVLLGVLAVREVGRRERLEAVAREEARVRELERQLFHAERLTTVGRLAAGIAHEINNPLEGMTNYLALARESLERGDLEASRRRLDGVREGLERAALVVRQVLAHADPAQAPRSPVDLNRVLLETADFVRSRREFAGIRFETALAPQELLVEGSPIMIGQVAMNLIVNACEAQPEGGEVAVATRREGGLAVAEVKDRGPGVPAEAAARIFEPFFSTKNSTGLGLSICHSIVRQHGGDLSVHAREGGGAVFRMSLPAKAAHTEAA